MACANLYNLSIVFLGLSLSLFINVHCSLSKNFYSTTCPSLLSVVEEGVREAIDNETRVGASLLRLHFHDCFVNGCDASILLDDGPNITSEKKAFPNNQSARGFEVVDHIKAKVENACPGVVSCADILTIIARDSVVYYGGQTWEVTLGRRDSLTANRSAANTFIPAPSLNLNSLISNFKNHGLSFKDMVALSGAHTVGFARCVSYRPHIYNDTNIDPTFAKVLQSRCPRKPDVNDSILKSLDVQTSTYFDNKYYQNLLVKKGLLHSDQQLYNENNTFNSLVNKYASNKCKFFKDFAKSMIKMGNIEPLTGSNGQVRLNCRKLN